MRFALGGDFGAAFGINPLAFLSLIALALYDVYAATVLVLRGPRLRLDAAPAWVGKSARIAAITVIAADWAWLVWRGV